MVQVDRFGDHLSRHSRFYPWLLVLMLWGVSFTNQADRAILIAVMPALRAEFHLTATQLALINTVFLWLYAIANIFAGRLGDGASRSKVIVWGLLVWSTVTGLVPLSVSFPMLVGMRGLIGVCEAMYYPAGTALIGDWHPTKMRSRALSLHQTAVFAGSGLGAFSAGLIADRLGWRAPFMVFGFIGLILAVVLRLLLRDAPHRVVHPQAQRAPLTTVLKLPAARYLYATFFFATAAATGVTVWAPTFVHDALGLNLAHSALYGSAPINIAGFIAVPIGGVLGDIMIQRNHLGRIYVLTAGLAVAAVFILPLAVAGSALAVAMTLLAASAGKGVFDGGIYASLQDVVPPEARASAVGLMTAMGFLGAGIAPLAVATIAGVFGMAAGLASLASLYVAAVVVLLLSRNAMRKTLEVRLADEEPAAVGA
jgi:MFS family permease